VNTRTKDLIDMLLLIEQGNLDNRRVASAIATTFEKRATHDIPRKLQPPAEWKRTFEALAGEYVYPGAVIPLEAESLTQHVTTTRL